MKTIEVSGARVAVVGDVHIGPRAGRDAFGHDSDAFVGWLEALLGSHDHLVLNGDIFQLDHELWRGRAAAGAALQACLGRVPGLAAVLDDARVHLVRGNHDPVTAEVLGAAEEVRVRGRGGLAVVRHGDGFDPVIGGVPGLSHAATWAMGRLRAGGLVGLAGWLEGRDIAVKGDRFCVDDGPYVRGAAGLMVAQQADVVVLGHTHLPRVHELPQGTYLNPGAACGGRRRWARVDLEAGRAEVLGTE